jgi:hypothetical protein
MRRFGALTIILLSLSNAANCRQPRPDETLGILEEPEPKIKLSPSMIEEMGGFNFVQAALANATLPGKSKGGRRKQPNGLETRQNVCLLYSFVP